MSGILLLWSSVPWKLVSSSVTPGKAGISVSLGQQTLLTNETRAPCALMCSAASCRGPHVSSEKHIRLFPLQVPEPLALENQNCGLACFLFCFSFIDSGPVLYYQKVTAGMVLTVLGAGIAARFIVSVQVIT